METENQMIFAHWELGGEMEMKDKPNRITTVLKVVVTGEFYDDDATEETLRYAVEQDLEDAGFDVDVILLKEQEAVKAVADGDSYICSNCGTLIGWVELYPGGVEEVKHKFCPECGRPVKLMLEEKQ